MDSRFVNILNRRGVEVDFCLPVFEKCKEFKLLKGDEYHIANTLHEFGLMSVMRVPKFNKENIYIGVDVYFKSMFENENI